MKKTVMLIIILFLNINCIQTYASSKIVMEKSSKRVLYSENMKEKKLIASITKIMTSIIVIENCNINNTVEVGQEILSMYGTNIYIEVGEKLTLYDLLHGLMLQSGNDAAMVLAINIGGTEEKFVEMMNAKAKEIGMNDTIFNNPHGLDDYTKNTSTAYDMALLSIYAYNNDVYREISSTKKYTTKSNKKSYIWYNRNTLLSSYKYCTAGKNGYTPAAGKTLVTNANKNGMDLTIVTLDVQDSYNVHKRLYEEMYDKYKMTKIISKGNYSLPKEYYEGNFNIDSSFYYPLSTNEMKKVSTQLRLLSETPEKKIGYMDIKLDDKIIKSINVYKGEKKEDNNIFKKIIDYLLDILNKLILGRQNNLKPGPFVPMPLEIKSSVSSNL